ncbi:MAG TPA: hypothetical protein VKT76_01240 [Bradyrhizobium sp.]|nr:hypothetical protein [Bradyrhizobium sp.]
MALDRKHRTLPTKDQPRVTMTGLLLAGALSALIGGLAPVRAVEQCRFIQAKVEREACYQRQETALTAKRQPEPRRDKTMEALEEMKHEDEALNRQLRSICRGC